MTVLTLNEIAEAAGASGFSLDQPVPSADVGMFRLDSRKIEKGDLFVAMKGEKVDGHDFLKQARDNGALAVLVERDQPVDLLQLKVDSCEQALRDIARASRTVYTGKILAITGSSGKTTTKEMVVAILQQQFLVDATEGNQNNELGLPLTLINSRRFADRAVLEMGARQQGDIASLMRIAQPHVSVITNIGVAHMGVFGSRQAIAETKSEIFHQLDNDGCAVLNLDDEFIDYLQDRSSHVARRLTYSVSDERADVFARDIFFANGQTRFRLYCLGQSTDVLLPQAGMHVVSNALCAAACATALGVTDLACIQKGLCNDISTEGRNKVYQGFWQGQLIDDSYNANPFSVKAAIDALASQSERKILILGDMGELGEAADSSHQEVLAYAEQKGIDHVFVLGEYMTRAGSGFKGRVKAFSDREALLKTLRAIRQTGDVILLKGSRYMAMESLIDPILNEDFI